MLTRSETQRAARKSLYTQEHLLPDDLIIYEIVTQLPAKDAVRCKAVSKLWCSLIEGRKFIEKHMRPHTELDVKITEIDSNTKPKFTVLYVLDGLKLEKCNTSGNFYVRNNISNQTLGLPTIDEKVYSRLGMSYIASTNEYAVLYLHRKEESSIGIKVLTLGTDLSWRSVQVPFCWRRIQLVTVSNGISFIGNFRKPELGRSKLIAFQFEDERILEITMPESIYLYTDIKFVLFSFELKAALGYFVKEVLHIWICSNVKKSIWDERRIVISSQTIKDYPSIKDMVPHCVVNGWLYMLLDNRKTVLIYNINFEEVYKVYECSPVYYTAQSIVRLKGMQ